MSPETRSLINDRKSVNEAIKAYNSISARGRESKSPYIINLVHKHKCLNKMIKVSMNVDVRKHFRARADGVQQAMVTPRMIATLCKIGNIGKILKKYYLGGFQDSPKKY